MSVPQRTGIMLCYPATPKRIEAYGQYYFTQPKLNGERCLVEYFKGKPILVSSYGNQFLGLEHIEEAISKLPPFQYDGELYIHGVSREEIHSIVSRKKKKHEMAETMQFHIFDIKSETALQYERIDFLAQIEFKHPLYFVHTVLINKEETSWEQECLQYTENGYEGIIIRKPDAFYEPRRCTWISKFKPTFMDSYEIRDVIEATTTETESHEAGLPLGMAGAFTVKSKTSEQLFQIGSGKLSHNERREIWQKHLAGQIVGKQLRVKHEKIATTNGVPVCAVAFEVYFPEARKNKTEEE